MRLDVAWQRVIDTVDAILSHPRMLIALWVLNQLSCGRELGHHDAVAESCECDLPLLGDV